MHCRCITVFSTQGKFSVYGCQIFCLRLQFLASDLADIMMIHITYIVATCIPFLKCQKKDNLLKVSLHVTCCSSVHDFP